MDRNYSLTTIVISAVLLLSGCGEAPASAAPASPIEASAGSAVIDSILPMEEEIRRFAATVDRVPTGLTGGAASRDQLVEEFIAALEREDTAAIARAHIDRAEFIHLYFPHTVYTAAPYEMKPSFIWFQMMNLGNRGITRAYQRYGGKPLDYRGYTCAASPTEEGPNRLWDRCVVRIAPDGEEMELRLFGMILEREGRFKFVTFGNDL